MPDIQPRWLSPEQAATYTGRRVDELPRLVRRGLFPRPSMHFGPRSPRYDREALDALFERATSLRSDTEALFDEACRQIREQGPARRPKAAR